MYYLRRSKKRHKASTPSFSAESPTKSISTSSTTTSTSTSLVSLLVSYIEGLKSLKPVLKLLYSLICSSLSYEVCQGNFGSDAVRNCSYLEVEDTITLSAILFKELHKRLLTSSDDAFMAGNVGLAVIKSDVKDSEEDLLLLLRCCVLLVRLHPYNHVLTEQFQVAVALLRRLSFQERESNRSSSPIPSQSTYHSCTKSSFLDFNAKSPALNLHFIQKMQEVYLDEVFADRSFLECLAISYSVSSTCQKVPVRYSIQIESVLEVIAAHFLLSISGKNALLTITERLTWTEKQVLASSEVSLLVASSIINHPVVKSAPTLLFSHLVSLVSEVIGIHVLPEKVGPSARCTQIYLSSFYETVNLYCEHMSKLMTDSCSTGKIVRRPFECYFHSEICEKIDFVLADLDNAWRAQSCKIFNKSISSMTYDAISYIKKNILIVDESYRNEAFSFLSSLITRLVAVESDEALLQTFKKMTVQDFCLLASILKLMSCSLLQATYSSNNNLDCMIALLKRKADPVNFFSQYKFHVSIQVRQFVVDFLKPHHSAFEEFELMFVHFSGLLSLSLVSGMRSLVQGSLFFMLVLLNFLALDLGNTEFWGQSVKSGTELRTLFSQKSSLRIASNFQKERRLLCRGQTASDVSKTSGDETCDGKRFLKCSIKNQKDIDELADFIECKPWRDYNARLSCKAKIKRMRKDNCVRRLRQEKTQVHSYVRNGSKRKVNSSLSFESA